MNELNIAKNETVKVFHEGKTVSIKIAQVIIPFDGLKAKIVFEKDEKFFKATIRKMRKLSEL